MELSNIEVGLILIFLGLAVFGLYLYIDKGQEGWFRVRMECLETTLEKAHQAKNIPAKLIFYLLAILAVIRPGKAGAIYSFSGLLVAQGVATINNWSFIEWAFKQAQEWWAGKNAPQQQP
ncbi:hypothetical protein FLL45_14885 [Aliikangiella marina]|uniref:Uncharacterized protein n=1 Tax=Aliikangiella marina TaxID=1712262 RepID=A0A545T694_9GAMM|nr:hypothetical protein [Aliikangiella marina]TQV72757.1 hypothetical protein FLL45_14885 [Aliikangiella marina]